jgi:FAD/FMN-containing dehydrogenase
MNTDLITQLKSIVGPAHVLTEAEDMAAYCRDWRGRYTGNARCVVRPRTAGEVSAIVKTCMDLTVPIVPQAGNTGLVGGAVPLGQAKAVILNVSRMNTIRSLDPANNSMVVEAGTILAHIREAAEGADRLFPMLLGSVGSCEAGGLISTNAGGTGVLRYGNMRELVLGLEVVLPDGEIWNGLRALRKDNAGYDLKQLFIGAEGTLGIITAATLKLFPRPTSSATAMVALASVTDAIALLSAMKTTVGNRIEAFELMSRSQLDLVTHHGHDLASPMPLDHPYYVLIEIADNGLGFDAGAMMELSLTQAMDAGLVADAVMATDLSKAERIWALRHNISEANKIAGFTVSNDTSVPISAIPDFIAQVDRRLSSLENATICHVGHVGDGNIHVVVVFSRAHYATPEACESVAAVTNAIVHEESVALNGSIAAEHGIGLMHIDRLVRFKSALDIEMMRHIKSTFDPRGLMNPGKILTNLN